MTTLTWLTWTKLSSGDGYFALGSNTGNGYTAMREGRRFRLHWLTGIGKNEKREAAVTAGTLAQVKAQAQAMEDANHRAKCIASEQAALDNGTEQDVELTKLIIQAMKDGDVD